MAHLLAEGATASPGQGWLRRVPRSVAGDAQYIVEGIPPGRFELSYEATLEAELIPCLEVNIRAKEERRLDVDLPAGISSGN